MKQTALLKRLIEIATKSHYGCEDDWYSCPKHPEGCANEYAGSECTCGADESNAQVEKIVAEMRKQIKDL